MITLAPTTVEDRPLVHGEGPIPEGRRDSFPPYKGDVGKETNVRPVSAATLLALRPTPHEFNPQLAWTLLQEEPEELEWTWYGFVPRGTLGLLVAYMKTGKSTLAYDLALAVSRGVPFLGFSTEQGGVLLLALEERQQDVLFRLRDFGINAQDPVWIVGPPLSPSRKLYEDIPAFIQAQKIGLVIIDSLSRFAELDDENDNSKATRFMAPLANLAHGTNTSVLLIHHEPKGGGEAGRNVRGAGAFLAVADLALTLKRTEGGVPTARTLEVLGRYQEYAPGRLRLNFDNGRYVCSGTEGEQDLAARREKALGALKADPQSVDELAPRTGLTPRVLRPILEGLRQDEKQVGRVGKGRKGDPYKYFRPDRGTESDSLPPRL